MNPPLSHKPLRLSMISNWLILHKLKPFFFPSDGSSIIITLSFRITKYIDIFIMIHRDLVFTILAFADWSQSKRLVMRLFFILFFLRLWWITFKQKYTIIVFDSLFIFHSIIFMFRKKSSLNDSLIFTIAWIVALAIFMSSFVEFYICVLHSIL